jgi:RHS repeat-associated protein
VVEYVYDSWGKILSTSGTLASSLGGDQPFRYRGYVYDPGTGWYYLQSRYYDPATGRFISADVYLSTGQGVLGHNSFAYCLNNPSCRVDPAGSLSFADILQFFYNLMKGGGGSTFTSGGGYSGGGSSGHGSSSTTSNSSSSGSGGNSGYSSGAGTGAAAIVGQGRQMRVVLHLKLRNVPMKKRRLFAISRIIRWMEEDMREATEEASKD